MGEFFKISVRVNCKLGNKLFKIDYYLQCMNYRMNGLSHVFRQRITSVRFRGRSSKAGFQIAWVISISNSYFLLRNKLRRSNDSENEIGTSLAGIQGVTATNDISRELDFVAKIDSLVDPSLGSCTELGENKLKGFVSYDSARYKWHHRYQMQITLNI